MAKINNRNKRVQIIKDVHRRHTMPGREPSTNTTGVGGQMGRDCFEHLVGIIRVAYAFGCPKSKKIVKIMEGIFGPHFAESR